MELLRIFEVRYSITDGASAKLAGNNRITDGFKSCPLYRTCPNINIPT